MQSYCRRYRRTPVAAYRGLVGQCLCGLTSVVNNHDLTCPHTLTYMQVALCSNRHWAVVNSANYFMGSLDGSPVKHATDASSGEHSEHYPCQTGPSHVPESIRITVLWSDHVTCEASGTMRKICALDVYRCYSR